MVPSQRYDELVIVRRSGESVEVLERLDLGDRISLGPALIDTEQGTFLVVATSTEVLAWGLAS